MYFFFFAVSLSHLGVCKVSFISGVALQRQRMVRRGVLKEEGIFYAYPGNCVCVFRWWCLRTYTELPAFIKVLKVVVECSAVFYGWRTEAHIACHWPLFGLVWVMIRKLFSFVLEAVINSIYDNCKKTFIFSTFSCVTTCNVAIIFRCIYAKTPSDDHYNFLPPELDGQFPLNFARWSVKQPSTLQKKFDWSGKEYLSTVMENVGQFSHIRGNSVLNLFFNFVFNDNFFWFCTVNNFETLHMYQSSIKYHNK